jgi:glycosyltransferase involved in cell wall biosynthesis
VSADEANDGGRGRNDAVSVIVPAHDAASTLGDQLAALAAQDLREAWELLVVDNGSTDGTAELAASWVDRIPHIRVVPARQRFTPSYARNVGIEQAEGSIVAFCDADDVVTPSWIRHLVGAMTDADLVAGALDLLALNDDVIARDSGLLGIDMSWPRHGFLPAAASSNLAVRRDVALELGGFDETFTHAEDVDFSWRAQLAGFRFASEPSAIVRYRLRTGVPAMLRQSYAYGRGDALLYARHRGEGMPRPDIGDSARVWGRVLVRTPPALLSSSRRTRRAREAAYRLGRLRGSLAHHVLFV